MQIRIGDKIYKTNIYLKEDIKKLENYMFELGFGHLTNEELYDLWGEISENYCAGWLFVPDTLKSFCKYLASIVISYDTEEEKELCEEEEEF
jgi:hypothetical protein